MDTLELLTTGEMALADRLTIASGTPGSTLMERAGRAVAAACAPYLANARRASVAVFCGPGNNGGDGYVAARLLAAAGHDVVVGALASQDRNAGDARAAACAWSGPTVPLADLDLSRADLIVDALFGAGLARNLDGAALGAVARINARGVPVVSVDVPSGLDGDTGRERGACVRATATVTFFRPKPGHLLLPGRERCGALTLADIGIADAVLTGIAPRGFRNAEPLWRACFPIPGPEGHKYGRGHVVVVSGAMPTTGAARLAARGAARIGAGLVTVASPPDAVATHAAHLDAVMLRPCDGARALAELLGDGRKNAVVLGPGLGVGEATRRVVEAALAAPADPPHARACVLDADALTSFADDAGTLAGLIGSARGPVVVTPHGGEFARLFGRDAVVLDGPSKLACARAGARRLGAVLVHKGDDTVVAAPDGRASINEGRAPWLATAGSGDVLAGMIGGLLAQAMPPFEAASAAVFLHAAAARRFGPGLIAEDLPETLPAVLRPLFGL